MRLQDYKIFHYSLFALSLAVYFLLAYFTPRESFTQLLLLYTFVFAIYLVIISNKKLISNINLLILISISLRLVFLLAEPALSNDFFRFIWDGRLTANGLNPYLSLPIEFIQTNEAKLIAQASELLSGLGSISPVNYSCYMPLNQAAFLVAGLISPESIQGSITILRLIIISADIASVIIGIKILEQLALPTSRIFWYALNPLVIIELSGNLHFEGLMVFFLFLAIHLLLKNKNILSAISLSLAISIKLVPLLFLPLFIRKLRLKKSFLYYLIVAIFSVVLFIPFFDKDLLSNIMNSIDLYFRKFEFNGSIYYVVLWIGYQIRGYNVIQIVGPYIGLAAFLFTIIFSLAIKNEKTERLLVSMLFVLSFYYFVATTVMPWYIIMVLAISIFTKYRFPILWTLLLILSYQAYSHPEFHENLIFIGIEYALLFVFLIVEIFFHKKLLSIYKRLNFV